MLGKSINIWNGGVGLLNPAPLYLFLITKAKVYIRFSEKINLILQIDHTLARVQHHRQKGHTAIFVAQINSESLKPIVFSIEFKE